MTLTESPSRRKNANWWRLIDPAVPPEISVWQVALDESGTDARVLSGDERQRAARFRFPVHRDRYIAGRAALRTFLADALKCEPEEIEFRYSEFGKPQVEGIEFNVAHSEDIAVIAISERRVGVDVEITRPVEFDQLARTVFSPAELQRWEVMTRFEKARAFYALWTRKEALLKAIGCGITEHVQNVSTFFEDSDRLDIPGRIDSGAWTVKELPMRFGCAAAIAFELT